MRAFLSLLVFFSLFFQETYQVTVGQVDSTKFPDITISVNVEDNAGSPVTTLKQDDFSVTEDGKTVELIEFAGMGDSRPVDVVFVFDTTGSMDEEINGVIETSVKFAEELESQGRDYRLGLVTFGDKVRGVYQSDGSLTDDAEEFKRWVQSLNAEGGDGDPENAYGALKAATQMQFRDDSQIIFLLITDAPAHVTGDASEPESGFNDPDLTITRALELLKTPRPITVYPITLEDADFQRLGDETGGTFFLLAPGVDFTGIITTIGETIATQYLLTYKSPRDVDDGTRREIKVKVGEVVGSGEYIEQHLINIRSNLLIGLACLFPLLLGLLAPFGWQIISKQLGARGAQPPGPVPGSYPPPQYDPRAAGPTPTWNAGQTPVSPAPAAPAAAAACAFCRAPIRPGARFCAKCGQQQPVQAPAAFQPPTVRQDAPQGPYPPVPGAQPAGFQFCPNCGGALRPGAKFCARCGNQTPN